MRIGGWRPAVLGLLAGWCILGPADRAAAAEVLLPEGIFVYQPVASAFGQTAPWANPAALSHQQSGSMIMFTSREGRLIRDWGMSTTVSKLAVAYRHLPGTDSRDYSEYLFAVGAGRQLNLGLSYRYVNGGPGYLNKRHLWNVSALLQRNQYLSIGARAENINRGRIEGERSDIRYVYGAAARLYQDLVTVSFDVDMTQNENLSRADFRTGIEVRPKPGIYLYADFDNHSRFNLGFRLNFEAEYVGHYHNFDRDGKSVLGTSYIGSVRGRQPSLTPLRRKTLMVSLDGELPENPKIPFFGRRPLRFIDYVEGIHRAADDRSISQLFLTVGELTCGLGKVEELTGAIKAFRSGGKPVTVYLKTPNNLGYLLASAGDRLIIPPVSELGLIGLHADLISIKGLMDKVGVEAEIERVDEFKTAPEPLLYDRPTEPNRQQINRLLDRLYAEMVDEIAANRNLPREQVAALIDEGPLTSAAAVECGLADERAYHDEATERYAGGGSLVSSGRLSMAEYVKRPEVGDRWGEPPWLAVIIADGSITDGRSGGKIGDFEMLDAVRRAREDGRVKGVVLRVNSPGGSALASDLIRHEVQKTAEAKPLVISMGNTAASGGYYISSITRKIYVDRSTLTGSIGVFGGKGNLARLFDKIGIYTESWNRGRHAGMYSLYEPFTPEERAKLKDHLRQFYDHFVDLVAEARGMTPDSVNALGRGQVWTGTEAVGNGLADGIGGFHEALDELRRACRIGRGGASIIVYPEKRNLLPELSDLPSMATRLAARIFGGRENLAVTALTESEHIFFCMPYNIEIE